MAVLSRRAFETAERRGFVRPHDPRVYVALSVVVVGRLAHDNDPNARAWARTLRR
jgi:hypothetical protein